MSDGLHFLDIIFFAMIAAFLVLRLRSVLGRRTGAERPPEKWPAANDAAAAPDNVIELPRPRRAAEEPPPASPAGIGLTAIRAADPGFDTDSFVAGARGAFQMIVGAFATGDKGVLKPLLAADVYQRFAEAIDNRARQGETLETELATMRSAEIVAARMEGTDAVVTLRFVTDQVNLLKDSAGRLLEGDPGRVVEVIDEWTFRRNTRANDPNWLLVATHTPDDGA